MGSDVRHVRGEAQKELVKKFEVFSSNGRSRWQIWSDWITMSAIAVSNATDTLIRERVASMYELTYVYNLDEMLKLYDLIMMQRDIEYAKSQEDRRGDT